MRKPIEVAVFLVISLVVFACTPLVNMIAFYPDNENVVETDKLPPGIEELKIQTQDKLNLSCLYLPSPDSNTLLIYFHGNAGNIYDRIPSLLTLHESGVNVLGVSYRGYGKSEGNPSEEGIYRDGEAVFKYAINELGFEQNNILIFGRSIGTTVAINTAQNRQIAGLILVTPLTKASEHVKASGLGPISSFAGDSFDNLKKIENLVAPLLVIHGTKDNVIPYSMGVKIYEKARVGKELITINGAKHNNLQQQYAAEYWQAIFRFINQTSGKS